MSRQAETSAISKSVLATLSSYEAPVIIALCALGEQTARSEGGFEVLEVKTKVDAIANGSGNDEYLPPPRFDDVLGIIGRLQEVRTLGGTLLCVLLVYALN